MPFGLAKPGSNILKGAFSAALRKPLFRFIHKKIQAVKICGI
jgi:hypothetical protein